MQAYSKNFPGTLYEVWFDQIYGSGQGSRLRVTDAQYTSLDNILSVHGNFHDPMPQTFRKTHSEGLVGSHRQFKQLADGRIYSYDISGTYAAEGSLPSHSDPGAYNSCVERLAEFVRGSTDLSIDTFQGKQTLKLVTRLLSVRKIVQYLAEKTWRDTSVVRRRYSSVARKRVAQVQWSDHPQGRRSRQQRVVEYNRRLFVTPMKDTGSLWLEFQYGLKPTLQTIHDLVSGEAVRAGNHMRIRSKNGRAGVSAKQVVEDVGIDKQKHYTFTTTSRTSFRYRIDGTYLPSNSHLESLSRLTSLNPASIAWELLPFSFVVDWFIDVGGYLRSLETAMISNLGQFKGYQTFTKLQELIRLQVWHGDDPQGITHSGQFQGKAERREKSRVVLNSFPYPKRPVFKADLSSGRLLNAAALLSQVLDRKK